MSSVISSPNVVASGLGFERPTSFAPRPLWDVSDDRPYGKLATETVERLGQTSEFGLLAKKQRIQESYAHRISLNKRFDLWSNQWGLTYNDSTVGTARMVLIQGQKTEIINTWIFPKYPSTLPVYAAELISMGGQQRLSFIDIQTPGFQQNTSEIERSVLRVHNIYKDFAISEQPPAWAITDTLGHYFFRRTGDASHFPAVVSAYLDYMGTLLNSIWPSLLSGCIGPVVSVGSLDPNMTKLRDYQHHHLVSSPGNLFLSKLFGEQWTDRFLHDFLFSQP